MNDHAALSASYWVATSGPVPAYPPLTEHLEADTVVIGAGFTGLSAAYHLASAGTPCIVLEANEVGWGASGRNGGMVVPRYKHTYPVLAARYGTETALAMYQAAHQAVDGVEQMCRTEAMDCEFARCGHLTPFVHEPDEQRFAADAQWLAERAGDRVPRMLDRDEIAARTGTPFYRGAYFEPRGGSIHPLRFCLQLGAAVARRGARIFTRSPVTSWERQGSGFAVRTRTAAVRCRSVLIATDGYTDLTGATGPLKRVVVPVTSSLIATERLPEQTRNAILPSGNVVTDAKRLTNYFRISRDGRMIFGGRGGASNRESARIYRRLAREMGRIYPALADTAIAFRWSGRVAVTLDGLPHVASVEPGVHYAIGFNGRGVALSVQLGRMLAEANSGRSGSLGPLTQPSASVPFHALQLPGKKIVTTYYRALDALGL